MRNLRFIVGGIFLSITLGWMGDITANRAQAADILASVRETFRTHASFKNWPEVAVTFFETYDPNDKVRSTNRNFRRDGIFTIYDNEFTSRGKYDWSQSSTNTLFGSWFNLLRIGQHDGDGFEFWATRINHVEGALFPLKVGNRMTIGYEQEYKTSNNRRSFRYEVTLQVLRRQKAAEYWRLKNLWPEAPGYIYEIRKTRRKESSNDAPTVTIEHYSDLLGWGVHTVCESCEPKYRDSNPISELRWDDSIVKRNIARYPESPPKLVVKPPPAKPVRPKTPAAKAIQLEPIDAAFVAVKNANVRAKPAVRATRVATLRKGETVTALGRVKGKNWFLVERGGKELGYVYGSLLLSADEVQVTSSAVAPKAAFVPPPASVKTANGRRVALVIGNDDYQTLPDLNNARKDARGMAGKLRTLGFDVILKINAGRREIGRTISDFQNRLAKAEVGLVFYAGHGIQADGKNYLVPSNARIEVEENLRYEGVDAGDLLEAMERAGSPLNIVILDACRDNPLPRRSRSAARGLAVPVVPSGIKGTAIIYSAAPGQTAQDGPKGGHGVFTGELLKVLDQPGLKLEDVFKNTAVRVSAATGGKQDPWINSSVKGDFYFRRDGGGKPATGRPAASASVPPPVSVDKEALFWQSIKESDDAENFQAYLDQYPTGSFAALARIKLKKLRKPKQVTAVPSTPPMKTRRNAESTDSEIVRISAAFTLRHIHEVAPDRFVLASCGNCLPIVLMCKGTIRSPTDLKGRKIIVGSSSGAARTALMNVGAVVVQVMSAEWYAALQRGIVDCAALGGGPR